MVKKPPTMQETRIRSLGQEDPLKKEMATHSSILALWTEALEESDTTEGLHSLHFLGPNSASSGAARSLRLGFPSLVAASLSSCTRQSALLGLTANWASARKRAT